MVGFDRDTYYLHSYKLAEKLSERLDEMGKDLTSMIEEVNGASATLSKTNRADEPVSPSQQCVALRSACSHFFIDFANRTHPQLAPIPAAGHRPGHFRVADQGCCSSEGRSVHLVSPGLWVQQHWHGARGRRRRLLPLLHGPAVEGMTGGYVMNDSTRTVGCTLGRGTLWPV